MSQQPPAFKGATCKGSYALGTACGNCERCTWEREKICGKTIRPGQPWVCTEKPGHTGECVSTTRSPKTAEITEKQRCLLASALYTASRTAIADAETTEKSGISEPVRQRLVDQFRKDFHDFKDLAELIEGAEKVEVTT